MDDDQADDGAERDADEVQQLEHSRALAAAVRVETFGKIHRHHHANEPGGDALHCAAQEEHRVVAVRHADRDARQRGHGGGDEHHHLSPELFREPAGDEARERRAHDDGAGKMRDLGRGEKPKAAGVLVRWPDVGQRGADDRAAEIEQQPAAAGDYQKIERIAFDLVHS